MKPAGLLLVSMILISAVSCVSPTADRENKSGPGKSAAMIPELNWEKRSDWIDVKTDVTPAAKGDGVTDDTEAIQTALDVANKANSGISIYFPPGAYRITKTIILGKKEARLQGMLLIGHGRSTKIVWDGEEGGRMLWLRGAANSRYVGIVWDGRGKAAVGIDHAASHFETELRHQHEAFLNFTDAGIRIGKGGVQSAEILYENCLFENCSRGVALMAFNDYDNTFDGCEFRGCAQGIVVSSANAYVRDCHFESSATCDISLKGEHCSSIRRCTSTGSNRFLERKEGVAALTIQDCQVGGWKNPEGAVTLFGAPVLMMDCVFTNPPNGTAPVRVEHPATRMIISNNKAGGSVDNQLLQGPQQYPGMLHEVPAGGLSGMVKSPEQSFLKNKVRIPGKVFDAKRDFGAVGDGVKDDTAAIRKAIAAARSHGKGAIAYIPSGRYIVTETIEVAGADLYVGGSGFCSALIWKGKTGGTTVQISNPERITLENIAVGFHDYGKTANEADIVQTGSDKPSFMLYDHVYVYGMYQKQPFKQGLRFVDMKKQDTVLMRHVNGNLRFIDAAQATFLVNESYEGVVVVEGTSRTRDGFLGVLTRLTTASDPALIVKNNHSIVMSDFYVEQADSFIHLEGGAEPQTGRITIQGAKIDLLPAKKDNVLIEIDNYQGEFTLGHDQFYPTVPVAKIYGKGDRPLDIVFAGNFFYKSKPDVKLGSATKLTWVGNRGVIEVVEKDKDGKESRKDAPLKEVDDTPGTNPVPQLIRAFDDLRRLGELDLQLNHPEHGKTRQTKNF